MSGRKPNRGGGKAHGGGGRRKGQSGGRSGGGGRGRSGSSSRGSSPSGGRGKRSNSRGRGSSGGRGGSGGGGGRGRGRGGGGRGRGGGGRGGRGGGRGGRSGGRGGNKRGGGRTITDKKEVREDLLWDGMHGDTWDDAGDDGGMQARRATTLGHRPKVHRSTRAPRERVVMPLMHKSDIQDLLEDVGVVAAASTGAVYGSHASSSSSALQRPTPDASVLLGTKQGKRLHGNLVGMGFRHHDVLCAMEAVGTNKTNVLDWLCLRVPEHALPRGFGPSSQKYVLTINAAGEKPRSVVLQSDATVAPTLPTSLPPPSRSPSSSSSLSSSSPSPVVERVIQSQLASIVGLGLPGVSGDAHVRKVMRGIASKGHLGDPPAAHDLFVECVHSLWQTAVQGARQRLHATLSTAVRSTATDACMQACLREEHEALSAIFGPDLRVSKLVDGSRCLDIGLRLSDTEEAGRTSACMRVWLDQRFGYPCRVPPILVCPSAHNKSLPLPVTELSMLHDNIIQHAIPLCDATRQAGNDVDASLMWLFPLHMHVQDAARARVAAVANPKNSGRGATSSATTATTTHKRSRSAKGAEKTTSNVALDRTTDMIRRQREREAAEEQRRRQRIAFLLSQQSGERVEGHVAVAARASKGGGKAVKQQAPDVVAPIQVDEDEPFEEVPPTPHELQQMRKRRQRIRQRHTERSRKKGYERMMQQRRRLPSWSHRKRIVDTIAANQVTVICGETGCGKTTQVGQFVLDHIIENGDADEDVSIVCTQPRRLAAIGVAERVSAERCEPIGAQVGYSIRLERRASEDTQLLFCTTGILLRRLQSDVRLTSGDSRITHVIVDEVHERTLDGDYLLVQLRDLLTLRSDLKLILMSATIQSDVFSAYFDGAPVLTIPGFTHPVGALFLEHAIEESGYVCDVRSPYAKRQPRQKSQKGNRGKHKQQQQQQQQPRKGVRDTRNTLVGNHWSERTYDTLDVLDMEMVNLDLLERLILHICESRSSSSSSRAKSGSKPKPKSKPKQQQQHQPKSDDRLVGAPTCAEDVPEGAVLVFLPGMAEISKLFEQLSNHPFAKGNNSVMRLYALHSTISNEEQRKVFIKPPKGCTKVILSTNIAETSITIDDVTVVIDTCRAKETRYDALNGMSCLEDCFVSVANAMQRRGRSGRTRSGLCYHLITEKHFRKLDPQPQPEILRVPLYTLCLRVKCIALDAFDAFMDKFIQKPPRRTIQDALTHLTEINALHYDSSTGKHSLTALGFHLAMLPIEPKIGRILVFGAIFQCLDPVLTIAASLSLKSPFLSPMEKRAEANEAQKPLRVPFSDHLTLIKTYQLYRDTSSRERSSWCRKHFLSKNTLSQMSRIRSQFGNLLCEIGFIPSSAASNGFGSAHHWTNANANDAHLISSVICGGLYPSVLRCEKVMSKEVQGKVKFIRMKRLDGMSVYVHPASVLHEKTQLPHLYVIYHELVKTSQVFLRSGSVVSPLPLLLFGDDIHVHHATGVISTAGGAISFQANAKLGVLIKELRKQLDTLLTRKISQPDLDIHLGENGKIIQTILKVLSKSAK